MQVEKANIPQRVETAFREASRNTGADFDFLLNTAIRESALRADAKAPSSTATGYFQFIEQTWLELVHEEGAQVGLQGLAGQIERSGGKFVVKDRMMRDVILDLRKDPEVSAQFAGIYAQKNTQYLQGRIGRSPSQGEVYLAHFLGAGGASRLIELANTTPEANAAAAFPAQARANKAIFYQNGQPRSVSAVLAAVTRDHSAQPMSGQSRPLQSVSVHSAQEGQSQPLSSPAAIASHFQVKPSRFVPSPVMAYNAFDASKGSEASALPYSRKEAFSSFTTNKVDRPFESFFRTDMASSILATQLLSNASDNSLNTPSIPDIRPQHKTAEHDNRRPFDLLTLLKTPLGASINK